MWLRLVLVGMCQQLRHNIQGINSAFPEAAPHQKWSALSSGCAASPGRTAGGASRRAVTAYTTSAAYSCGPVPSSSLKLLQDASQPFWLGLA